MTPNRITSLVAVREVLNKTESQHTPLFISLVDNGKNSPFDCRPVARIVFGPGKNDFPELGRDQSPFDSYSLPSLRELQKLLVADLRTARRRYTPYINDATDPAANESHRGGDAQLRQLKSLTDVSPDTSGVVLSFPSPSLDSICRDNKVEYDNVVHETMTGASILPGGTLLSFQHSNEGTTFTTLLSGSVAWILWPPIKHNVDILLSFYNVLAKGYDGTSENVLSELEGGVCFVQSVGDAIRIPPFCPLICFSTETSILATYSIVTATQLAGMLHKLPLLLAWFRTEIDGERKKNGFVAALLPHMAAILQGDFETDKLRKFEHPYVQEGPLRSLLQGWDEVKHAVASTLDAAETKQLMTKWTDFLVKANGRKCWICGDPIRNKERDMPEHFKNRHWPTEKATGASNIRRRQTRSPGREFQPEMLEEEKETRNPSMMQWRFELQPHAHPEPDEEAITSESARELVAESHEGDKAESYGGP